MSEPLQTPDASGEPATLQFDSAKLAEYQRRIESEQSLMFGAIAGLAAALIGASLWAVVTVLTEYQIGWMAVAIGCLVGLGVRYFGKGMSKTFGIMGAVLALFGCLLGNLLSAIGFAAQANNVPLGTVLGMLTPGLAVQLLRETFSFMDVVFYAIAIYQGYQFSFRQPTDEELASLQVNATEPR